jgi:hypothetical protein
MVFLTILINTHDISAEEQVIPIKLGLTTEEQGSSYDSQYGKYSPVHKFLKEKNIESFLVDYPFYNGFSKEDLNRCHVMALIIHPLGYIKVPVGISEEKIEDYLKKTMVSVLKKWVEDGGGLLLVPELPRYLGNEKSLKLYNYVLKTFGLEIQNEGIVDTSKMFVAKMSPIDTKVPFWQTNNIVSHPVTKDVKNLSFPFFATAHGSIDNPYRGGVATVKYSPEWQILVKGGKKAKSCPSVKTGKWVLDLKQTGHYSSEPPVIAVRQYGKGRIVCYPIQEAYTWRHFGLKFWNPVVESIGDGKISSDGMKMWINAVKWLAEPALKNRDLGQYKRKPYKRVVFPKTVEFDSRKFWNPKAVNSQARGIFGAHTSYSDGSGTVADYVAAAKAAGLSFIVFTDPLEKMTQESLDALKKDCKSVSDSKFLAIPGIEFNDKNQNRWLFWGQKINYPPKNIKKRNGVESLQWDGNKIHYWGKYHAFCEALSGTALISIKSMRQKGCHPEKMWWFGHYVIWAYENGMIVDDNFKDYLSALRDLRSLGVISYTKITKPDEIVTAAKLASTYYPSLNELKKNIKKSYSNRNNYAYVGQGPQILLWQQIEGDNNWQYTRGTQRIRLGFAVHSENGIAEVIVHDADRGVFRRFKGKGEKNMSREFEACNDQQHYLVLEVVDLKGKKAISSSQTIYSYKNGHVRCGDNLNMLDFTDMLIHPDRDQIIPLAPGLGSACWSTFGLNETIVRDGGPALLPLPRAISSDGIDIKGIGHYPPRRYGFRQGRILDPRMASREIIIDSMHFRNLTDYDGGGSQGNLIRDLAENEYFERTHTIFLAKDRSDLYIKWNYRRIKESMEKYAGRIMWNEGEFRFKKDVELASAIPLIRFICPVDKQLGFGGGLLINDGKGEKRIALTNTAGIIDGGGYLSQLPCGPWYYAFFAPKGNIFSYSANISTTRDNNLFIGLGKKGLSIKAGTVLKYRFATGLFYDQEGGRNILLRNLVDHTAKVLNMSGGHSGYPIQMKTGKMLDASFFFTVKAEQKEAVFTLGPQQLIVDLPIKVEGLDDNGCAAVYSSARQWFRFVPVYKTTAYFQEPIEMENEIWAGNIFVCDDKRVKITAVIDGQKEGQLPFIEIHNPEAEAISTKVSSPAHTPIFGGISFNVELPAGESVIYKIPKKGLKK